MIKLYYWNGRPNLGDMLSPFIVSKLYNEKVTYAEPGKADLFAIGSILHLHRKSKAAIWGSGFIDNKKQFELGNCVISALRGPLSALRYSIVNKTIIPGKLNLGDPGLFINEYIEPSPTKKYVLGIVPHISEQHQPRIRNHYGGLTDTTFISPLIDGRRNNAQSIEEFVKRLTECEYIITSSLHGMITADAYGIPVMRTFFLSGIDNFKFRDYQLSLNLDDRYIDLGHTPTVESIIKDFVCTPPSQKITAVKQSLLQSLPEL